MPSEEDAGPRVSPLAMDARQFRELGSQLVERIASFLETLPERPVDSSRIPGVRAHGAWVRSHAAASPGADPAMLLNRAS